MFSKPAILLSNVSFSKQVLGQLANVTNESKRQLTLALVDVCDSEDAWSETTRLSLLLGKVAANNDVCLFNVLVSKSLFK